MEFSRQENGSGLSSPSPGDFPDPGIEPTSPALAGRFFTSEPQGKPPRMNTRYSLWSSRKDLPVALSGWEEEYPPCGVVVLVTQSCPALCDPVDCAPPGSSVPGILQARILEWTAIPFSRKHSPNLLHTEAVFPGVRTLKHNSEILFQQDEGNSCLLQLFPGSSAGKESTCNAGDPGSIPGSARSSGEGIGYPLQYSWASLVAQLVKNPSAMRETWVWYLGWEYPLEKGKATHSSILAWRIPWTV